MLLGVTYLVSATCPLKTGSETGFSAKNLDRLLERLNFRNESRTGFKDERQDQRQDRVLKQNPCLLVNLSQSLCPVLEPCSAFLS